MEHQRARPGCNIDCEGSSTVVQAKMSKQTYRTTELMVRGVVWVSKSRRQSLTARCHRSQPLLNTSGARRHIPINNIILKRSILHPPLTIAPHLNRIFTLFPPADIIQESLADLGISTQLSRALCPRRWQENLALRREMVTVRIPVPYPHAGV